MWVKVPRENRVRWSILYGRPEGMDDDALKASIEEVKSKLLVCRTLVGLRGNGQTTPEPHMEGVHIELIIPPHCQKPTSNNEWQLDSHCILSTVIPSYKFSDEKGGLYDTQNRERYLSDQGTLWLTRKIKHFYTHACFVSASWQVVHYNLLSMCFNITWDVYTTIVPCAIGTEDEGASID